MTQPLIEKLQHLDSILHDIRERYDASHNELLTLKSTPQVDTHQIDQLQQQLDEALGAYEQSVSENHQLQQHLDQMDEKYQTLAEAHHNLNDDYSELLKKYETLEQANKMLLEKNRLAKEHTKVVMQRLTLIDQVAD